MSSALVVTLKTAYDPQNEFFIRDSLVGLFCYARTMKAALALQAW